MKKFMLLAVSALMLGGLVASCATLEVDTLPKPEYAYKQYPVQELNVASIEVVSAYNQPMQPPNVEHLMPDPLPRALEEWARTRFRAGGGTGTLVITIKDAHVISQALPTKTGVTGMFRVDQSERFESHVEMEFHAQNVTDASGLMPGTTKGGTGIINVNRGITRSEDATIQERDRTLTTLSEALLLDVDASGQKMLAERLPFLRITQ